MADRTSADLFGTVFEFLAEDPENPAHQKLAKKLWRLSQTYDFSPYQMEADPALIKLNLAKRGLDEDGYKVTVYAE